MMKSKIYIHQDANYESLSSDMSILASQMILKALTLIEKKEDEYIPQNEKAATYAKKINKQEAKINWQDTARTTIAKINGYCIGGGLNLAVCCDIRICSEKSKFAMPAAKLSLGYPFSSIKRLFDIMGPGMAKHFMFTAEKISANEAVSCGLVQKLVTEENLETFVNDYAFTISKNAPLTIKAMKQIGIEILKNPLERDLSLCDQLASACFDSEDYKEGRKAFMEKRTPNFKGL